ncbi:MAG: hypothetical protein DME96_08430 [Verrucomicrobia bacterium]|nr:MAG: hypothetical protein DME93_12925 [Verrucomicrobiota bacterium]PYJ16781.1 MAG: hypothetical protein DME96_08430 [Verrucomicrobiota bacterium]
MQFVALELILRALMTKEKINRFGIHWSEFSSIFLPTNLSTRRIPARNESALIKLKMEVCG